MPKSEHRLSKLFLKPRQEDKVTRKTTVERLMDEAKKSHKLSGQRMEKIGLCNKTPNGLSLIK